MTPFSGVLVAASLLLVVSGAAKITSPEATERSLHGVGLPSGRALVVALGVAEIAAGAAALAIPGPVPPLSVAALYLGFAGFVILVLRSDSSAGCGCFGVSSDVPPGRYHLGVVAAAAAAALASATGETLFDVIAEDPAVGISTAVAATVVAVLARAVLTVLPDNRAAATTLWRGRTHSGAR